MSRRPANLDPVADATDAQYLLLPADGIRHRDQFPLPRQKRRGEARYGVLFGITTAPEDDVDGSHDVPAIRLGHPIGHCRSVRPELGYHGLALEHAPLRLSRAEVVSRRSQGGDQNGDKFC